MPGSPTTQGTVGTPTSPNKRGAFQEKKLPAKVRTAAAHFVRGDEHEVRFCIICNRITAKEGKVTRVCIVTSLMVHLCTVEGDAKRLFSIADITEAYTCKSEKRVLLKIAGQEDLLLHEKIDERNTSAAPAQYFPHLLTIIKKVREATGCAPLEVTTLATPIEVAQKSPKDERKKKPNAPSVRERMHLEVSKAEDDAQQAQQYSRAQAKNAEATRGQSPTTFPLPGQQDFPNGAKPPPPPPRNNRLSGVPTQGSGYEESLASSPASPAKARPLSIRDEEAASTLRANIEQLQAERELAELQLETRRRELEAVTETAKQWQDQLQQQQQLANDHQTQFNEYLKSSQQQYQEYLQALYQQNRQASEQRLAHQEMTNEQNERVWGQLMSQLMPEEDEGSDSGSDSDGYNTQLHISHLPQGRPSPSPSRSPSHAGNRISVKVQDSTGSFSFPVTETFWADLTAQIETVAGFSDHPLCSVAKGDDYPLLVNEAYFAYFASNWANSDPHCVSVWEDGKWGFVNSEDFWARHKPGSPVKTQSPHTSHGLMRMPIQPPSSPLSRKHPPQPFQGPHSVHPARTPSILRDEPPPLEFVSSPARGVSASHSHSGRYYDDL